MGKYLTLEKVLCKLSGLHRKAIHSTVIAVLVCQALLHELRIK